jgi:Uncharacterized conserved protein (COG2071)
MRIPRIHGVIRRRILVNYRADADVVQRLLPPPFAPKLHAGSAIAGICLIRLEQIRPRRFPRIAGISSENAAHRIAVTWSEGGEAREGVYIPRRDSGSLLNRLAGGRLFPGEHHRATFKVVDTGSRIDLQMQSADGAVAVQVVGHVADALPEASGFADVEEASRFFEGGSLGYSPGADHRRLDGLVLKTETWQVAPLAVDRVESSYFADLSRFPAGSVRFDCALIMRNIDHEWRAADDLYSR